ncbi:class I tRNA ligase family protein, partial [Candidatus Bathyarchaeota archaeon]|nr:class I tRNA ligase family protein [Candidatus Bathyarchaeota archaeon]
AQSESVTGEKPFVKYWLHTGFLKINGEKMAKSTGNYITVREALKMYSPESIRLFIMFTHYRSEIDFTEDKLKSAQTSLNRLNNTLESLENTKKSSTYQKSNKDENILIENVEKQKDEFVNAMNEDFNTPQALAALFEMSKEINRFLDEHKQVSRKVLETIHHHYSELGKTLGLFHQEKIKNVNEKIVDDLIRLLFDLREKLRKKKEYALSDEIRTRMEQTGLLIEDTDEGPKWKLT